MVKRSIKILLGILLVPFCAGFSWQLAESVFSAAYRPVVPYVFSGGFLAYAGVHLLFRKPILSYVIGHELTHALFAVLSGGSIKAIQASERGGRVTVTKSNFLITLAPYFFPLYTVVAIAFYLAACHTEAPQWASNGFLFLAGATWSFHLVLTLVFLQADQSDIREQGALFSYPLIYLFNVAFAGILLAGVLATDVGYFAFFAGGIIKSTGMIALVAKKAYGFALGS